MDIPKHAYIVFTHRYLPVAANSKKLEVHEDIEIVDRLKKRYMNTASAIIDVANETVEKTRIEDIDYHTYYDHFKNTYPVHHKELMTILGREQPSSETTVTEEVTTQDDNVEN